MGPVDLTRELRNLGNSKSLRGTHQMDESVSDRENRKKALHPRKADMSAGSYASPHGGAIRRRIDGNTGAAATTLFSFVENCDESKPGGSRNPTVTPE